MTRAEDGTLAPSDARRRLETVGRACSLLKVFADDKEMLSLAEIAQRTGFEKTIAFRLVHTLVDEGLLRRVEGRRYSSNVRILGKKPFQIGYAAQADNSPFSAAVTESLKRAATKNQIDLLILDNHYSARTALRNAERLIAERVDVALEFQTHEKAAAMIASLFRTAGIPVIAIEVPQPGATFYGIDNYRVGLTAGRTLARWAKQHWAGQVDEVLLLELEIAGPIPHLRLSGAEGALRQVLADLSVHHLDTRGEFLCAFQAVRKHLQRTGRRRTLLVGINDPAVLGALRAFEEAGLSESCAAIGLGAIPEARAELRCPGTRLIGSIAFFPEHYGDDLIHLALDILHKRNVPPAVYANCQMVTSQNVDQLYPNELYPNESAGPVCDHEIR
jgi:ribose transport system substrate-binding protein